MYYTHHEMQDVSPEAFAIPLFWSRLIEAAGEQGKLTKGECRELIRSYCCTVPYFEASRKRREDMAAALNRRLAKPVNGKTLACLIKEGEAFYEAHKPSIDELGEQIRKGAGFSEDSLDIYTIQYCVASKAFATDREKLEELLLNSGFHPLYKD